MPTSGFEALREHLLHAGIAPRHVRRYIGELHDHFDDLTREETANGASQSVAEIQARKRLGSDGKLAAVMLAHPELRSLAARHPLAVFGLGPVAMVVAASAAGLAVELSLFKVIPVYLPHPSIAQRESFVFAIAVWNSFTTFVAPLAIATALCIVGLRQRMSLTWAFVSIACACFFGAFQEINFSDDGHHGTLIIDSGLLPPFPAKLVVHGLCRIAATVAIAGATYWAAVRWWGPARRGSTGALTHAGE